MKTIEYQTYTFDVTGHCTDIIPWRKFYDEPIEEALLDVTLSQLRDGMLASFERLVKYSIAGDFEKQSVRNRFRIL